MLCKFSEVVDVSFTLFIPPPLFFSFRLYAFPTKLKDPVKRDIWIKLVNRVGSNNKLWEPSKDNRICSLHFADGKPTPENPNPTLNLGYDSARKALMFSPPSGKRKRKAISTSTISSKKLVRDKDVDGNKINKSISNISGDLPLNESAVVDDIGSPPLPSLELDFVLDDIVQDCDDPPIPIPDIIKLNKSLDLLFALIILLIFQIKHLSEKLKDLTDEINELKTEKSKSQFEKLITSDKNCAFHTNLEKVTLFEELQDCTTYSSKIRSWREQGTKII